MKNNHTKYIVAGFFLTLRLLSCPVVWADAALPPEEERPVECATVSDGREELRENSLNAILTVQEGGAEAVSTAPEESAEAVSTAPEESAEAVSTAPEESSEEAQVLQEESVEAVSTVQEAALMTEHAVADGWPDQEMDWDSDAETLPAANADDADEYIPPEEDENKVTIDALIYTVYPEESVARLTGAKEKELSGTVTIPTEIVLNGVSYPVTGISGGALMMCMDITELVIPASIITIGNETGTYYTPFNSNFSLERILVEPSNPNYKSYDGILFSKDGKVLLKYPEAHPGQTYQMPETVEEIATSAFMYAQNLTTVEIPSSVLRVGAYAFGGCNNLTTVTYSAPALSEGVFTACPSLSTVQLNSSITEIPSSAFRGSQSLQELLLPSSVVSIGGYSFYQSGLRTMIIPESVQQIGMIAFGECASLERVEFQGEPPQMQKGTFGIFYRDSLTVQADAAKGWTGSALDSYGGSVDYDIECSAHSWDDGVELQEPTLTASGLEEYTCQLCGAQKTVITPPLSEGNDIRKHGDMYIYYYNGQKQPDKYGFVDYRGGKFLIANGVVARNSNGITNDPEHPDIWYFNSYGQAQLQYTGLALYDEEWFYLEAGVLDTTCNGVVDYDSGRFYIAAGRLVREANGLVIDPHSMDWYYVSGGQVQTQYTGYVEYNGSLFFVTNGCLKAA